MTLENLTKLRKERYLEVLEIQKKLIQKEFERDLEVFAREISEGQYDNNSLKDGIERTFEIALDGEILDEVVDWCQSYFKSEHVEFDIPDSPSFLNDTTYLNIKIKI